MPTLNKIFAVIDPTTDKQSALASAARMASQNTAIALHVYEAVFSSEKNSDSEALQRAEIARHRAWVESLVAPIRAAGNEITVEVEWTAQWRDAIAPAAQRCNADLIIKTATAHSSASRRVLKTSDWTLLRNAHCPVYLLKKDALEGALKVLVALDILRDDELHTTLNDRVLDYGRAVVAGVAGSTLHAVNSYADQDHFVSPPDLAAKAEIERTAAHTVEGAPEKVIPEVADQVGADIVIIGTAARDGIKAAVIGNTAEKILDAINTNILTVNV